MLAQSPQIRITRFKDLEPQSGYDSPVDAWRPDGPLTARPVYVLLGPPKPGAVTAAQPVVAVDKGMSLTIVECPPGGMPVLPTFLHTRETFVCLKGRFRVRWGEHGEQETFLDAFDMIALPPSVCRSFVNVTDESAFLLVMLAGQTGERAKEYSPRARAERGGLVRFQALAAGGMVGLLAVLLYALWPSASSPRHVPPAVPSAVVAPVTERVPAAPVPPAVPPASAAATITKTGPGRDKIVTTQFLRIAPPPPLPPNMASVLPVVAGREGTVHVGDLAVTVLRTPRRDGKGSRIVDYTVTIKTREGTPVSAADVRVRGLTVEESTVEAYIAPADTAGVYQGGVIMPAAGLRQMTLRIVPGETVWQSLQQIVGLVERSPVHIIKLQT